MKSFAQFISLTESQRTALPVGLKEIHQEIFANVKAGDPTPFKAFRRNEYLSTVGRMGYLDDNLPADALLADEIVITGEVREMALKWLAQGALLFGLSDKPDEASLPTASLAARGYLPIHQTQTHVVGMV